MTKTFQLTACLFVVLAATPAVAQPTITVDESTPFTAHELADAIQLRVDSNATIDVRRDGDRWLITIDGHTRPIELSEVDPHDAARIVALVAVGMDAPTAAVERSPALAAVVPPAPDVDHVDTRTRESLFGERSVASAANWALRAAAGVRSDGRTWTVPHDAPVLTLTIARRVGQSAHAIVGIDWDGNSSAFDSDGVFFARAGIELRHRWFAIEGGARVTTARICEPIDKRVTLFGPYLASRIHLFPVSTHGRVFTELGIGQTSGVLSVSACAMEGDGVGDLPFAMSVRTMHATLGLEVPL
jgi:hypothetical protein